MDCYNNTPIVGELQTLSLNRGTYVGYKAQRLQMDGTPITTNAVTDTVTVLTYGGQAEITSNGRNGTKGVITFYYTKSA